MQPKKYGYVLQVRGHTQVGGGSGTRVRSAVTNGAIVFCAAGARVSLQSDFDENIVGAPQGRTSSFVGFLVYE